MPARSLILAALTVYVLPASAEPVCTTHDSMIATLSEVYDETVRFRGLDNEGVVIEILSSRATWSMIATLPDGRTCLLTSGRAAQFPKTGTAL